MDRATLNNLFNTSTGRKPLRVKEKGKPKVRGSKKFRMGVENGDFSLYTALEVRQYFYYKAEQAGYKPFASYSDKEHSAINGYIRDMGIMFTISTVDFLWEADHDLKRKEELGAFIFSKGWRNSLVPLVERWLNGEKVSDKKVREWREEDGEDDVSDELGGIVIE